MRKTGNCKRCEHETYFILHRKFHNHGAVTFLWVCEECEKQNPDNTNLWIPREKVALKLSDKEIDELPLLVAPMYGRCIKCGSRGAELHHWAPKHLFGDEANDWPQDYLCVECHQVWHGKVTPNMCQ